MKTQTMTRAFRLSLALPQRPAGTRRLLPALGVVAAVLVAGSSILRAHEVAEEMAGAARNFLAALTPEQAAKARFALTDWERFNFHYIPRERRGLPLKEMTPAQQHLAHGLLSTALSHRGYLKATTIMSLEAVLRELEQGRGPTRDPELYFFSVFGEPSVAGAWAWRVEGHHLSLNFTLAEGGHIAVSPSFFGTNPGEVRQGPRRGLRVLEREEDLGRRLAKSLEAEQKKLGLLPTAAPQDIITGTNRHVQPLTPQGLPASQMTAEQREVLHQLLDEYVHRHRPELAEEDLAKIRSSGAEKVHFCWAGSIEPGAPHYYRIQGPTFLLEYDNTQNNANHIHTVWRNFQGDFGEDLLRKHYDQTPH